MQRNVLFYAHSLLLSQANLEADRLLLSQAIPGYWTNHRKRTGLHCRRACEWDHQINVDLSVRRPAQEERRGQSSRR